VSRLLSFEVSLAKSRSQTEFTILNGNLKNISINHLIASINHSTVSINRATLPINNSTRPINQMRKHSIPRLKHSGKFRMDMVSAKWAAKALLALVAKLCLGYEYAYLWLE